MLSSPFTACPGEVRGSARHKFASSPSWRGPDKVGLLAQDREVLRAGAYLTYPYLPETLHKPKQTPALEVFGEYLLTKLHLLH